jgi:hypothetical protein
MISSCPSGNNIAAGSEFPAGQDAAISNLRAQRCFFFDTII